MKDWERQEKDVARKQKGKVVPGSGRGYLKGDALGKYFFVEAKHSSLSNAKGLYLDFKSSWLCKLLKENKIMKRYELYPLLNINIGNSISYSAIQVGVWFELCGNKDEVVSYINLKDKKQIRLQADSNYNYTVVQFNTIGDWILLPDHEIAMIIKKLDMEVVCKKDKVCPKPKKIRSLNPSYRKLPKTKWKNQTKLRKK